MLVTRPAGHAAALGERLAQLGFRPVYAPLMEIVPLDTLNPAQQRVLGELSQIGHVIFVSRNAIVHGMAWIEKFWPELPAGVSWYTVGEASAALLAGYGVRVIQPDAEMTSEGLLVLPSLQRVAGQRVLIVKGEGGRQLLRERLTDRGARVDELSVYRRQPPGFAEGELLALIREQDCGAILLSSGEGLHNMVSLLEPADVGERVLIVPGARVAEEARQAGFRRVVEAGNATDEAMVQTLLSLSSAQRQQAGERGKT